MGKSARVGIACSLAIALFCLGWLSLRPHAMPQVVLESDPGGSLSRNELAAAPYAGHLNCAKCHTEIHQSHMTTPHSRTFSTTLDSAAARSFDGSIHFAGDEYGEYHYELTKQGLAVGFKDRFSGRLFPLNFAIGSGKHAVTFLTLLQGGSETLGVEHRMTWFRHEEHVGITPGQSNAVPDQGMSFFGKVIHGDEMHRCVNCHITTGEIVDAEIRNLTAGIHCERCHGPGAQHSSAAAAGDMQTALGAIRSQWTGPEEVAMCGDCHRMPHDVDSEMLKDYPKVLTRFQPIGILKSRCYLNSEGALRCTTCHDAHAGVESRSIERQTESCRSCHSGETQTQCAAGETMKCIDCHMPPIELVPGVYFHDHWIRVRADKNEL